MALTSKYDYGPEEVRLIAENLRKEDYIREEMGIFYIPTPKGEQFIQALYGMENGSNHLVPPLPSI